MASVVRHEYRELHEEPHRDTSGALLPLEVGCEPGVSEQGTLRIFSRVYDPSFMTPVSCSRAQSMRESPLESHRGLWALKSPRTSESGEDGSEGNQ